MLSAVLRPDGVDVSIFQALGVTKRRYSLPVRLLHSAPGRTDSLWLLTAAMECHGLLVQYISRAQYTLHTAPSHIPLGKSLSSQNSRSIPFPFASRYGHQDSPHLFLRSPEVSDLCISLYTILPNDAIQGHHLDAHVPASHHHQTF